MASRPNRPEDREPPPDGVHFSGASRPRAPEPVCITAADPDDSACVERTVALAKELGLPVRSAPEALALFVTPIRLELRDTRPGAPGPIFVDFVKGPTAFRRFSASSRKQPLVRAIGSKAREPLTVVDATAGLGRDTFLLACLGCRVVAIERSATMWALLRDGIDRAATSRIAGLSRVMARIQLLHGDSRDLLAALPAAGSVYVDPMFPSSTRTALAKKEMMACRALLGEDVDAAELLRIARSTNARRVVVKRHPHDAPLAPNPAIQFRGRTVRYDVYLNASTDDGNVERDQVRA